MTEENAIVQSIIHSSVLVHEYAPLWAPVHKKKNNFIIRL